MLSVFISHGLEFFDLSLGARGVSWAMVYLFLGIVLVLVH